MSKQGFGKKFKSDKKFRFEFLVGTWTAVVAVVLVVCVVFVAKVFLFGNVNDEDTEIVDEADMVAVTSEAVIAKETPEPYENAIINGNEEDFEDDEEEGDEKLKDASFAYATTTVNVRNEDSLTATVITKLQVGDRVDIVEYDKKWTKIRYNGTEGYVSTIYLSTRKPADEPTMTSAPTTVTTTSAPTATKKPVATKKPAATKKPVVTKKPTATKKPVETVEPKPVVTEPPVVKDEPVATQAPAKEDNTSSSEEKKDPEPTSNSSGSDSNE